MLFVYLVTITAPTQTKWCSTHIVFCFLFLSLVYHMFQFLWVVLLWLLLRYSLMFIKFSVKSIHQYILEAGMHYLRLMTFRYRDCRDEGVLSNQPVPRSTTICKIRPPILHRNIMWSILPVIYIRSFVFCGYSVFPSLLDFWLLCLLPLKDFEIINSSPTKLRRDIVTLPSVRPSFRNILVNILESTSFNGFLPNLVHT